MAIEDIPLNRIQPSAALSGQITTSPHLAQDGHDLVLSGWSFAGHPSHAGRNALLNQLDATVAHLKGFEDDQVVFAGYTARDFKTEAVKMQGAIQDAPQTTWSAPDRTRYFSALGGMASLFSPDPTAPEKRFWLQPESRVILPADYITAAGNYGDSAALAFANPQDPAAQGEAALSYQDFRAQYEQTIKLVLDGKLYYEEMGRQASLLENLRQSNADLSFDPTNGDVVNQWANTQALAAHTLGGLFGYPAVSEKSPD